MRVRALADHYDSMHCRRTRGQVYVYHGPVHKYIVVLPEEPEDVLLTPTTPSALPSAATTEGSMPTDVYQRLQELRKIRRLDAGAGAAPEADTHLTPTPVQTPVQQLAPGALPEDLVPLPPSMPLPSMPLPPADDGRDLLQ